MLGQKNKVIGIAIIWVLFAILFIRYMILCHNSLLSICAAILGFITVPFALTNNTN